MDHVNTQVRSTPSPLPANGGAGAEGVEPIAAISEAAEPIMLKSLACKIFNTPYRDALPEVKEAFRLGIQTDLEAHLTSMREAEAKPLAERFSVEISSDPSLYDSDGSCAGYAYLFAAHLLSRDVSDLKPESLVKSFSLDERIKQAAYLTFVANSPGVHDFLAKDSENKPVLRRIKALSPICGSEIRHQKALEKIASGCMRAIFIKSTDSISFKAFSILSRAPKESPEAREKIKEIEMRFTKVDMRDEILKSCTEHDSRPIVAGAGGYETRNFHAITLYASKTKSSYLVFDSNIGVMGFESLEDLATKVPAILKKMYGFTYLTHIASIKSLSEAST